MLHNLHSKWLKHFHSNKDVICLSGRFLLFFPLCYRPFTKKLGSFTDIGQWSREWWKSWGFREQPDWQRSMCEWALWVSIVREQPDWQRSMCEWTLCCRFSSVLDGGKEYPAIWDFQMCAWIVQLGWFCGTIPIWALWLYLSNFLNLFYKTSEDFCFWGFSFMVFLNYSLSSVKDLVELSSVGVV